jgi:hypothetical protein
MFLERESLEMLTAMVTSRRVVFGLNFLDSAVVVDKDKGMFVVWVGVPLSSLVSRAEETGDIMLW